jgi:serine/threonine protein kinase
VAIKIISKSRIKQTQIQEKVAKEIRMMKYLDHPNIIKLVQVVDTTSDIYIVMELVSGGELFEYISQKGK